MMRVLFTLFCTSFTVIGLPAKAVFDITLKCETEETAKGVHFKGEEVQIIKGKDIIITVSHVGNRKGFPAKIRLNDDFVFPAYTTFMTDRPTNEDGDRIDTIRVSLTNTSFESEPVIWSHFSEGQLTTPVEVKLTCKHGSDLY